MKIFFEDMDPDFRPSLDLLMAGYGKSGALPRVATVSVKGNSVDHYDNGVRFRPIFGGQSREIERIVYGADTDAMLRLEGRHKITTSSYLRRVLREKGVEIEGELPELLSSERIFDPNEFLLPSMTPNWGDFSEQNAIDCVTYFVRIMCDVQRFNSRMPTVGGHIHIALIDRDDGFRFISREEYSHEDHRVKRA